MERVPTDANESGATVMLCSTDSQITINAITGQFNYFHLCCNVAVKVEMIICVYVVNHLTLCSHSTLMTH